MKLRFVSSLTTRLCTICITCLIFAGCSNPFSPPTATPTPEPLESVSLPELTTDADGVVEMPLVEGINPDIARMTFDHSWMLHDSQEGDAVGLVTTTFSDQFYLQADIQNVPLPGENQFYEGWLVRNKPRSVISTGAFIQTPEGWSNQFTSETDLTDYTEYVVTLEPVADGDEGQPDPAPTDIHILEGKSN